MAPLPLALSVHNFISSVGADAGFAAIIGLAILVLLYFAHARETANLREQAALLTQRLQQAEARVAQLSRAQPAAAPIQVTPAPAAAVAAAAARAYPTAIPAAPAGVAAPALAAATRVVPIAAAPGVAEPAIAASTVDAPQDPVAEPAEAPATAPEPAFAQPVAVGAPLVARPADAAAPLAPAPQEAPASTSQEAPEEEPPAEQPAPAAAPGPVEPADPAEPLAPPALTAAGANGAGHERVPTPVGAESGSTASPPRPQPRSASAQPRRTLPPIGPPARRRSGVRAGFVLLVGGLLAVAAIVALVVATAGSGSTQSTSSAGRTTNTLASSHPKAVFNPASVTVAVLNGTATNQLAHRVAARLAAVGYKEGTIATAANQTEPTTVVAYLPGAKDRTDALHVASALKLRSSSVQPIDQSTQQVACPPPGACTANVVVTVGADLANS